MLCADQLYRLYHSAHACAVTVDLVCDIGDRVRRRHICCSFFALRAKTNNRWEVPSLATWSTGWCCGRKIRLTVGGRWRSFRRAARSWPSGSTRCASAHLRKFYILQIGESIMITDSVSAVCHMRGVVGQAAALGNWALPLQARVLGQVALQLRLQATVMAYCDALLLITGFNVVAFVLAFFVGNPRPRGGGRLWSSGSSSTSLSRITITAGRLTRSSPSNYTQQIAGTETTPSGVHPEGVFFADTANYPDRQIRPPRRWICRLRFGVAAFPAIP
jgi:hypothetical protein